MFRFVDDEIEFPLFAWPFAFILALILPRLLTRRTFLILMLFQIGVVGSLIQLGKYYSQPGFFLMIISNAICTAVLIRLAIKTRQSIINSIIPAASVCIVLSILVPIYIYRFVLKNGFSGRLFNADKETLQSVIILLEVVMLLFVTILFLRVIVEFGFYILYKIRFKSYIDIAVVVDKPTIVIANHAAYQDPMFAAKVLPTTVTAIMTSRFVQKWYLKPLLKNIFRVIVVDEAPIRRETPEIQQAIEALDRKEMVMIFPEGYLRRKEEVPLRRFGQGIWQILKARPETQVIPIWIEGNWGDYFSFKDGPPMTNKKFKLQRKIDVEHGTPFMVPAEILEHQMQTRIYLMNKLLEVREQLGLPPIPRFEVYEAHSEE
jgi:1-acyl-sn-glycerol-3-phosphate acyltransferase